MEDSLTILAEQLGTTVEYLWPIVIRQQYIQPWYGVLTAVVFGVAAFVFYRGYKYYMNKYKENGWGDVYDLYYMLCIAGCGVAISVAFVSIIHASFNLLDLINPDYAALEDVMKMISK